MLKNQTHRWFKLWRPSVWALILLQQKYDAAINALNTQVEADFEPLMLETKGDVYVAQNKTKEAVQSYEAALSKCRKPQ